MKVKLWGTRGSLPSSRPDTQIFGGHTSCVTITTDDALLVLDAGSGVQRLGITAETAGYRRIDILLTHLHMDHIQGLGFFQPLFQPSAEIHIWGPADHHSSLYERLNRYLSPPLFPVPIRDLPSSPIFHEVPAEPIQIGSLQVESAYVCHPGPTVGYRISGKAVVTYLPDHEPALGNADFRSEAAWTSGFGLAHGADLLIHDAQYSAEEYQYRMGWGHSTYDHALRFADLARVKQLLLFHHDPTHSDETLYQLYQENVNGKTYPFKVSIAREGAAFEF